MTENKRNEFSEKRQFPRENLKLWVHFKTFKYGKISRRLESLTDNLSAGGVGLITDRELEKGQMIMVTLFLPPEESRKTAEETMIFEESMCVPISVLSKVVWCHCGSDNEYHFGVQFQELDDYSRSILKIFLLHFRLYSSEAPVFN